MTAEELIEELKKYPPNAHVLKWGTDESWEHLNPEDIMVRTIASLYNKDIGRVELLLG